MSNNDILFRVRAQDAGLVRELLKGREAISALGRGWDGVKKSASAAAMEQAKAAKTADALASKAVDRINLYLQKAREQQALENRLAQGAVEQFGHYTSLMKKQEVAEAKQADKAVARMNHYVDRMKRAQLKLYLERSAATEKAFAADAAMKSAAVTTNKLGGKIDATMAGATMASVSLLKQLAGFGTVMAGLYTSVRLLMAEAERFVSLRSTAKTDVLSYAQGMEQVGYATGSAEPLSNADNQQIKRIIQKSGIPESQVGSFLKTVVAAGIDAKGPTRDGRMMSTKEALAGVEAVVEAFGPSADESLMGAMSSSMMDILRMDPSMEPKEIIGKLLSTFPNLRLEDPEVMARHVMPAVTTHMKRDKMTFAQSVAQLGAMEFDTSDIRGRRTSNASLQLQQELQDEMGAFPARPRGKGRDFMAEWQAMGGKERMLWTRGELPGQSVADIHSAETFRAFLFGQTSDEPKVRKLASRYGFDRGTLHGESKQLASMRAILSPADTGMKTFSEFETLESNVNSQTKAGSVAAFEQAARGGAAPTELQKTLRANMAAQGGVTAQAIQQLPRAQQGILLETAAKLADQRGDTAIAKKLHQAAAMLKAGTSPSGEMYGAIGQEFDRSANAALAPAGGPGRLGTSAANPAVPGLADWRARNRSNIRSTGWNDDLGREFMMENAGPETTEALGSMYQAKKQLRQLAPPGSMPMQNWEIEFRRHEQRQERSRQDMIDQLKANTAALQGVAAMIGGSLGNLLQVQLDDGSAAARRRDMGAPGAIAGGLIGASR